MLKVLKSLVASQPGAAGEPGLPAFTRSRFTDQAGEESWHDTAQAICTVAAAQRTPGDRIAGPAACSAERRHTHTALMSLAHDLDLLLWYLDGQVPVHMRGRTMRTPRPGIHERPARADRIFRRLRRRQAALDRAAGGSRYLDVELELATEAGRAIIAFDAELALERYLSASRLNPFTQHTSGKQGANSMSVYDQLKRLGLELPRLPAPIASYVPGAVSGNLIFASGQTPTVDGKPIYVGKLGQEISLEDGYQAARLAALNCVAELEIVLGDLNRVSRIIKVNGYVASAAGFNDQPKVINGASDLLGELWGESGRHARAAIGVAELPLGAPVEVELIAEIAG